MTIITDLDLRDLRDRMGDAATRADAECMMAILSREGVADTDDVPDARWLAWCEEAAERAAREVDHG